MQCLVEVGLYVINVLEADGYTHHVRLNTRRKLLLVTKLLMGCRRGGDDERLGVSDVRLQQLRIRDRQQI